MRYEKLDATNRVCNLTIVNRDGDTLTIFDYAVPTCNGTFSITDFSTRPRDRRGANSSMKS